MKTLHPAAFEAKVTNISESHITLCSDNSSLTFIQNGGLPGWSFNEGDIVYVAFVVSKESFNTTSDIKFACYDDVDMEIDPPN